MEYDLAAPVAEPFRSNPPSSVEAERINVRMF
jgi:hypothetical protein